MPTQALSQPQTYTLYYHPFSICSIMVLYTWELRGEPQTAESTMDLQFKKIDILHAEQIEQWFLCDINPVGQIPVLNSTSTQEAPIPDSLQISLFTASKYPSLLPSEHEAQIRYWLKELHTLSFFALSFSAMPKVAEAILRAVEGRLADTKISDRYRKALEFKLHVVKRSRMDPMKPDEVARSEYQASSILASLEELLTGNNKWLFGDVLTALDAHLIVLIARLMDVGKAHLVPQTLQVYASQAREERAWLNVMPGKKTVPSFNN